MLEKLEDDRENPNLPELSRFDKFRLWAGTIGIIGGATAESIDSVPHSLKDAAAVVVTIAGGQAALVLWEHRGRHLST